jgi:hypothetical protein
MRPVGQGRGTNRASACVGRSRVCAQLIFSVAVLVISPNFDGQHRKQCKWEGLEPGEASVSWLPPAKTALKSANSGASTLESLQNYRLGGLLVKLHMEPCVKPSQRGSEAFRRAYSTPTVITQPVQSNGEFPKFY